VTHHVPHPAARHPGYPANDHLLPIFCSDCSDLIEIAGRAGAHHWIFGHHHYSIDEVVAGVRLLSAQLGYPREQTGWTGPGLITV
jgi:hypothetical protein